jgi:DNA-binding XRE family transcriptional regulator
MKEDDAHVDYEPQQLLLYVEKKDGTYGPLKTGGYMAKNYLDDFFLKRQNLETECIEKLRNGEISPVSYYRQFNNMTAVDLAARVRISASKVRMHETPAGFAKATLEIVRRYAEVFDIPVANLFQIIVRGDDAIGVTARKTANVLLSVMEINRGKQ